MPQPPTLTGSQHLQSTVGWTCKGVWRRCTTATTGCGGTAGAGGCLGPHQRGDGADSGGNGHGDRFRHPIFDCLATGLTATGRQHCRQLGESAHRLGSPEVGSTKRISQSYGRFMRAPLIIIGLPISIRHPARRNRYGDFRGIELRTAVAATVLGVVLASCSAVSDAPQPPSPANASHRNPPGLEGLSGWLKKATTA